MNQYRVSLWIENEGDLPDLYFQLQTNVEPSFDELIVGAMVMACVRWVQRAEVELLAGEFWVRRLLRSGVSLDGVERMMYRVTRSRQV